MLLAMVATMASQASGTAELKVSGTLTPKACDVMLGNGGTNDYGRISINMRGQSSMMAPIDFTVSCESQRLVAFKLSDNRSTYRVDGLPINLPGGISIPTNPKHFGLKGTSEQNAGAWAASYINLRVDGQQVGVLPVTGDKNSPPRGVFSRDIDNGIWYIWSVPGSTKPALGKVFTGQIIVHTALVSNLLNEMNIDGSATISIKYL